MTRKLILATLWTTLFFSCFQETSNEYDSSRRYATSGDSRLYFNNIRSIQYEKSVIGEMDVYKHRQLSEQSANAVFMITIVDNWLHDEAYLVFDIGSELGENIDTVWFRSTADTSDRAIWVQGYRDQQYEFADWLYTALREDQILEYKADSSAWIPFSPNRSYLLNIKGVLRDYFELVNRI